MAKFIKKNMIHIDLGIINPLVEQAKLSSRRRNNFNFHKEASDPMHRMLHGMESDTYVQPHKHQDPDKREAFIILRGRVLVIEYNDEGDIRDWLLMDPFKGSYGVEIPPQTWHNLICIESGSVVYEVKDGPWDPADDKFFAGWAPREGEAGCREFSAGVLERIGIVKSEQ